jgi:predicted dehydrogenase
VSPTPVIGVLGLGSIGCRHARLLAERSDFDVPVYDTDPDAAGGLDGARMLADVGTLLASCAGVVIATPDALHAPQTIAACRAGVAVLVEKPVSDTRGGAEAMADASATTGVPVLVGHVLRHVPTLQRAAEFLADGAIGQPVSFHATLGAYETLELAHMRFRHDDRYRLPFDYVHEWHYLQWLLGPATRVVAAGNTAEGVSLRQEPNVIDALVELDSGATGTVHLDYVERNGARALRVVGDAGVLAVDLRAGTLRLSTASGGEVEERHAEERDAAFRRQLEHFADVIAGAPPLVTIAEATRAIALAEAVVGSCQEGAWQTIEP